jgi:predicted phosphodiesterase
MIVKRAIVTPDKHFPLHDPDAISCVKQAIEIVKPDTYIDLGDTGEWTYFSTHYWKGRFAKPMEDLIPLLESDINEVNAGMDWIDESLDKVKCKERHFIQGNHEVWLDKFVTRYPYLKQYLTQNVLKLKERGYKYHPYNKKKNLKIGKLNFTHGKFTTKYHAFKHLDTYGESIMYGHTHDLQRFTKTFNGGTISSWSLGCLKDIENDEDWLGGKLTNWNHAFAIVDWFKGGNFKVEVVEIIKGKTTVWGNEIHA